MGRVLISIQSSYLLKFFQLISEFLCKAKIMPWKWNGWTWLLINLESYEYDSYPAVPYIMRKKYLHASQIRQSTLFQLGPSATSTHHVHWNSGCPFERHLHDDVIKWKHFPRYWPFVRGIHRSPVNSSHKGQWRGALMFSFICTRINGWVKQWRGWWDATVPIMTSP